MTPEDLTIQDLVALTGKTTDEWPGNCSFYANQVAKGFPEMGAKWEYGHWVGPIHPDSFFGKRQNGFTHHAWTVLPDGRVLDPTRWVFEFVDPYIFVGSGEHYDAGGNALRALMLKPCPAATPDKRDRIIGEFSDDDLFTLSLASDGVIEDNRLSASQLFWIANLPFDSMMGRHASIYAALEAHGFKAMIPVDNYRRAFQ